MDRKRCLFEYQSILTKGDHLHIDEFNLWLVNSKVVKLQLPSDRPSSARSTYPTDLVGIEQSQIYVTQQRNLQAANTVVRVSYVNLLLSVDVCLQVTSEISFGNLSSTKKFSIGVVPMKNKIDRLTHDRGPDFFRSALKTKLETQQMHKDERLRKVAKVFYLIMIFG
jgi:hypothetical protein